MRGYRSDLAYIHDVGFGEYALKAAPGLLRILRAGGVKGGLIVDLGCGSGHWARELNRAGYRVLGIDQSPAMTRRARRRAPAAQFKVGSFFNVVLPTCDGITAIGECLSYRFDPRAGREALSRLFARAYRSLRPGGVFIFDVARPRRLPPHTHNGWAGRGWAVLVSSAGGPEQRTLRRRIISFRKVGKHYRRSEEVHALALYSPADLLGALAECGFKARSVRAYGGFRLPAGVVGIVAVKV